MAGRAFGVRRASTLSTRRGTQSQGLSWQTNHQGSAVTFTAGSTSFSSTATTSNGFGTFTGVLPLTSFYVDVILDSGWTGPTTNIGFLGISNVNTAFDYTVAANFKAWYWSGSWFGNGTNVVTPPTLSQDTYRIAVNYSNNNLYMKKNSDATIAQAAFTTGANYYLMMLSQSGYTTVGVSILNQGATFAGSGGLY